MGLKIDTAGTTEAANTVLGSFMGMMNRPLDRKITPLLGKEDWIGKLVLHYYEADKLIERVVPFYENANIQESQSSRLATYSPLGRAVNNFSYMGANSREFKVRFNITLPHLYQAETTDASKSTLTKKEKKKLITNYKDAKKGSPDRPALGRVEEDFGADRYDKHYVDTLDEMSKKLYKWAQRHTPMYDMRGSKKENIKERKPGYANRERQKVINKIASFVASIRSSTLNNAENPTYGTPIVKLSYGILYDNVPCVCDSYSVGYDPVGGFDLRTMLPRVITITMSLKEVRNFAKAEAAQFTTDREGIRGWEIIVTDPEGVFGVTTDPGGGWV